MIFSPKKPTSRHTSSNLNWRVVASIRIASPLLGLAFLTLIPAPGVHGPSLERTDAESTTADAQYIGVQYCILWCILWGYPLESSLPRAQHTAHCFFLFHNPLHFSRSFRFVHYVLIRNYDSKTNMKPPKTRQPKSLLPLKRSTHLISHCLIVV